MQTRHGNECCVSTLVILDLLFLIKLLFYLYHIFPVTVSLFSLAVYDVTKRETFTKLENWLNELETYTTRNDIVKMLVGNKIDKVGLDLKYVVVYQYKGLLWNVASYKLYRSVRENDAGCLSGFQDDHEVDRSEGLKFARKHSMLFIGK